jgi:hypothetical protein
MVALGLGTLGTLGAVGVARWLGWAAIAIGAGAGVPYVRTPFAHLPVISSLAVAIRFLIRPARAGATFPMQASEAGVGRAQRRRSSGEVGRLLARRSESCRARSSILWKRRPSPCCR